MECMSEQQSVVVENLWTRLRFHDDLFRGREFFAFSSSNVGASCVRDDNYVLMALQQQLKELFTLHVVGSTRLLTTCSWWLLTTCSWCSAMERWWSERKICGLQFHDHARLFLDIYYLSSVIYHFNPYFLILFRLHILELHVLC